MPRKPKVGGARAGAGRPPKPRAEKRSALIRISATPAVAAAAAELAKRQGVSLSDLGLEALQLAIARGSTR